MWEGRPAGRALAHPEPSGPRGVIALRHAMTTLRFTALLAMIAIASRARSEEGEGLRVSLPLDGGLTAVGVLVTGLGEFGSEAFGPGACRWCDPPALDASVRTALVWRNPSVAGTLSDLLAVTLPSGVVAYDLFTVRATGGDLWRAEADVLLVAESVAVTGALVEGMKYATARERPSAFYGRASNRDDDLSFVSGHVAVVFSAAAAGGTVARLRGYGCWPLVYAVGFAGSAFTGYLRLAADQHWLSDVLAGSAVGLSVGLLVPYLHREARGGLSLLLVPRPGGLALAGEF
jgi:membrane-associated phospholipid phosphatase